jgi:hypothetical protein
MAVAAYQPQPMSQLQRHGGPSSLADVLDVILDKGIVIDVFVRVALVGIELLTIDARIVIASVDTYLRFAEAVNRLELSGGKEETLPEMVGDMQEGGAGQKTKGMLEGAREALFGGSGDEEEEEESGGGGRSRSGSQSRSRSSGSSSRSSGSRSRSSGSRSRSSGSRSRSSGSRSRSSGSRSRSSSRGR